MFIFGGVALIAANAKSMLTNMINNPITAIIFTFILMEISDKNLNIAE
jgi:hypothetical protein